MAQQRGRTHGFVVERGGVLYLLITLLFLAVAQVAQANLLYWAFGLMIGALVVSVVWSWLTVRALEIERLTPMYAMAGEAALLRYRVVNRHRWLPVFGVVVRETWGEGRKGWLRAGPVAESPARLGGRPTGWVMHIGAGQAAHLELPFVPLRRGPLAFTTVELSVSFPFGVMGRWVRLPCEATVLVYPRLRRVTVAWLARAVGVRQEGGRSSNRPGGNEDFYGLREHRPGDGLRLIHWRRTARTGRVVSREMTHASPPRAMIALDLRGASDTEQVERAISLTASLVCDAHLQGCRVGLVMTGVSCRVFPLHHGASHRTRILEALATLEPGGSQDTHSPARHTQPTVVVTASGASGAVDTTSPRDGVGRWVVDASRLEQITSETPGGSDSLLHMRVISREADDRLARAFRPDAGDARGMAVGAAESSPGSGR